MSAIAFDETLDFLPLFADQTEDVILARWIAWANEGLDPVADADAWVDTREGSHWATAQVGAVRECARLYDLAGTEVPMSGFVLWSWGTYLDDLAAVWDVVRIPAAPALGVETFSGPPGTDIPAGVTISAVPSTPDDPAPEFEVVAGGTIGGGGTIDLQIQALEGGRAGNVAAGAITAPSSILPAGVTFTNASPTSSGTDPETDDSLRARLLQATAGKGPGAVRDYVRWSLEQPGVSDVQVVPIWSGPGTVLVVARDDAGGPVATAIVTNLQAALDPISGEGAGIAPIGATVTVDTSTLLSLDFAATATFETGYSWDGAGNTIAVGPQVLADTAAYLLAVQPGSPVVYQRCRGILATALGVHDVTAFTIDAGAGPVSVNVATTLSPPQTPTLGAYVVI